MEIRIHSTIQRSRVNGPGERFVIWVQGCSLGCPGCFNPETHSPEGGRTVGVDELAREILATGGLEGVTLSGGEPFQQAGPLAELCRALSDAGLSLFVFSGYSLSEIRAADDAAWQVLLSQVDILTAGRFIETQKANLLWRGSENQQVHFLTDRYSPDDFDLEKPLTQVEVTIGPTGEIQLTGFPDEEMRRELSEEEKGSPGRPRT